MGIISKLIEEKVPCWIEVDGNMRYVKRIASLDMYNKVIITQDIWGKYETHSLSRINGINPIKRIKIINLDYILENNSLINVEFKNDPYRLKNIPLKLVQISNSFFIFQEYDNKYIKYYVNPNDIEKINVFLGGSINA